MYYIYFSHVTAAHTEMKSADAAQNVLASLAKLIEVVPGGANNVRSIYLKTDRSPALPLFLSEGLYFITLLQTSSISSYNIVVYLKV